jgi:hypothetical protein
MRALLPAALLAALLFSGCRGAARAPAIPPGEDPGRWAADIERFAEEDRAAPAPPGVVVFVGSSSIRLWSTLAADMAPVPVLNRGFGGSGLYDAIHHCERLVDVHAPSLVVVFSGTNDLAGADAKSAAQVHELCRGLVRRLRLHAPDLTTSPSRSRRRSRARSTSRRCARPIA